MQSYLYESFHPHTFSGESVALHNSRSNLLTEKIWEGRECDFNNPAVQTWTNNMQHRSGGEKKHKESCSWTFNTDPIPSTV